MNNYNPYTRIQTYYSLLSLPEDDFDNGSETYGISMSEIHTLTKSYSRIFCVSFNGTAVCQKKSHLIWNTKYILMICLRNTKK